MENPQNFGPTRPLKLPVELLWEIIKALPFEPNSWKVRPVSYIFNSLLNKYMTLERRQSHALNVMVQSI